MLNLYTRRRIVNAVGLAISMLAMAFGLFWLCWILWTLLEHGLPALTPVVFTHMTPPPGSSGGLLNAIAGSLAMTLVGTLIGTPIGILAGTYLAEFGQRGWLAPITRFINDVLLSAPSIVIGLFVYEVYVVHVKHFSGWAGAVSLAVIVVPVVVRTTEDMLTLVPDTLREAAASIGLPRALMITKIAYRAARARKRALPQARKMRVASTFAPLARTRCEMD